MYNHEHEFFLVSFRFGSFYVNQLLQFRELFLPRRRANIPNSWHTQTPSLFHYYETTDSVSWWISIRHKWDIFYIRECTFENVRNRVKTAPWIDDERNLTYTYVYTNFGLWFWESWNVDIFLVPPPPGHFFENVTGLNSDFWKSSKSAKNSNLLWRPQSCKIRAPLTLIFYYRLLEKTWNVWKNWTKVIEVYNEKNRFVISMMWMEY